jgi:hypothetical protein
MNQTRSEFPLLTLPAKTELTLYLIKEELKSHKFFSGLRNLGLDDSYYHTDLSPIILANLGLNDETNETIDFYFALLDKYSQYIEPDRDRDSIMKEALNMYIDLIAEQKKRSV